MPEVLHLTLQLPPVLQLRLLKPPAALPAYMAQVIVGKTGPAGGTSFTRQSNGPLSALRVVWEDDGGGVELLDYQDDAHIDLIAGITVTATSGPGSVSVQRSGELHDSSWNWTPGRLWLGANGALVQIPPTDGNDVAIGFAVSHDRIYIDFQDPIELE